MTTGNRSYGADCIATQGKRVAISGSKSWSGQDGRRNPDGTSKWNPYSAAVRSRKQIPGVLGRWAGSTTSCTDKTDCWIDCAGVVTVPWNSTDDLHLYAKLAAKVKAHGFNAAVFVSQGNKVIDQAVSTISALTRSLLCLKRGNVSCALKSLGLSPGQRKRRYMQKKLDSGDISGAWLAMQYGWLPTLDDVFAAATAYAALTSKPRNNKYRVAVVRKVSFNSSQSPTLYTCKGERTRKKVLSYRLTEQLSIPRTLGLVDPATVVWEVTPFSFVIDWFLPIGEYLEALNVIPHLKGTWMLQDINRNVTYGPTEKIGSYYRCGRGPGEDHNTETLTARTVGNSPLHVPHPSVTGLGALKGKRIINAVALFHQQWRGQYLPGTKNLPLNLA